MLLSFEAIHWRGTVIDNGDCPLLHVSIHTEQSNWLQGRITAVVLYCNVMIIPYGPAWYVSLRFQEATRKSQTRQDGLLPDNERKQR